MYVYLYFTPRLAYFQRKNKIQQPPSLPCTPCIFNPTASTCISSASYCILIALFQRIRVQAHGLASDSPQSAIWCNIIICNPVSCLMLRVYIILCLGMGCCGFIFWWKRSALQIMQHTIYYMYVSFQPQHIDFNIRILRNSNIWVQWNQSSWITI